MTRTEPDAAPATQGPPTFHAAAFCATAFFGTWTPPWLLLFWMVWRHGHHGLYAFLWFFYGTVAGLALWLARRRRGPGLAFFLALASLNLFLVTPELALRAAGFRYEHGMRMGEGAASRFVRWTADGELFWTLPPGPGINAHGFRTRSLPIESQPIEPRDEAKTVRRAWVQGDSVAQQGFPEIAESFLNLDSRSTRFEVYNFSMAGWSSEQGRRLIDTLDPTTAFDWALVAYGWNDHWTAMGAPDHEIEPARRSSPLGKVAHGILGRLRLAQAARYVVAPGAHPAGEGRRVPLDRYEDNLVSLGEAWRLRSAAPVLVTLPSAHRLGVPDYLWRDGFVAEGTDVVALHELYVDRVRRVAEARNWPLLDLATELGALPDEDLAPLFLNDGIHLSQRGLAVAGRRTADFLRRLGRDALGDEPNEDAP